VEFNFPLFMHIDNGTILAYKVTKIERSGGTLTLTIEDTVKLKDIFENIVGGTQLSLTILNNYLKDGKGLLTVKEVMHPLYGYTQKHIYGYFKCGKSSKLYATYYSMQRLYSDNQYGHRETREHAYGLFIFDEACINNFSSSSNNQVEEFYIEYLQKNRKDAYRVLYSLSKPWEVIGHRGHKTYSALVKPQLHVHFDKIYKSLKYSSDNAKIYLVIASIDFIEQLLGSILIYQLNDEKRQLPFIVLSSASNLKVTNEQYIHLTPTNYYSEVGAIGLYIEIEQQAIQPLINLMRYHVIEAIKRVSQIFRRNSLEFLMPQELEKVIKTLEKVQVNILIDGRPPQNISVDTRALAGGFTIDPKALLKALLYHKVLTVSTCDKDSAMIKVCGPPHEPLSYEEAQKILKVFRTYMRQALICIDRVNGIDGDVGGRSSNIPSCYTRVRRFEDELYNILRTTLQCKNGNLADENTCLLFAYFLTLFAKVLRDNTSIFQQKSKPYTLYINFTDIDALVKSIVVRYLELGFHGFLHIFRKMIASQLNIRENLLGEVLIIGSDTYLNDMFVDNYVYRLRELRFNIGTDSNTSGQGLGTSSSPMSVTDTGLVNTKIETLRPVGRDNMGVLMLVYIRSSNSIEKVHMFYSEKENLSKLLDTLFDAIKKVVIDPQNFSKCYYAWLNNAQKIRAGLSNLFLLKSQNLVINLSDFEKNIASQYVEGYPMSQPVALRPNTDALRKLLYLPTTEMRRLFIKSLREYVDNLMMDLISSEELKNLKRVIEHQFRVFEPAILNYYAPQCFDGCYGCTLSRECEVKNPLAKEWITSKDSIRAILKILHLA